MHLNKMLATVLVALGTMVSAQAAEDLKIGMILPMTGPFAAYGQQIEDGARLYLAKHGDTVAGRKVKLIVRDDTGIAPEISKRHAQELLVNEHVDILAGFGLTPSAFSVAPLSAQTKKPMLVLNAATSAVTTKSPYIVRTSFTLPQTTAPLATWAARNGIKKVYTVVADYGPGHDSEAQFKKSFTAAGGQIVGEVRTPVKNPDFAPFLQRVKDSKPDAVFLFVPSGEQGVAFVKGYAERALAKAGIKLIATGDRTDEFIIDAMGDASLGMITSFHYAESHKSPENKDYVEAYAKAHPGKRASFMSVAGYDGMHVIFEALKKTGGDAGGDKFIAAASSLKWMSPRGPVRIDPATRDIVQTIYIRRVEKVNGKLQNVEFDQVADFKDPGKE